MKHAASWFEIPVSDYERAKKFYSAVFEAELGEMDVAGSKLAMLPSDQDPEVVGGALISSSDHAIAPSEQGSIVYLNANPNLQPFLDRAVAAGASVFIPKTLIGPDMGHFAQFRDSEGNRVGLYSKE